MQYTATSSQLRYLGYLSKSATQNVTVHCKNYIAWFDRQLGNHEQSLKFRGTEDQVFEYMQTDSKFSPQIIRDGCSNNQATWDTTVFKFTSNKFIRLPITDMAPTQNKNRDSMFGLELGPVCFV